MKLRSLMLTNMFQIDTENQLGFSFDDKNQKDISLTSRMILQPLTTPICENNAHNKSSETL